MVTDENRFVVFLVTGGVAAAANIGARWLFQFAVSFEVAVAGAFVVGLATGFVLARIFVFTAQAGDAHWQFVRYTVVNVIALAQVWLISVGLARVVFPKLGIPWLGDTSAHVIGVLSPVASSYILHKHFSFRTAGGTPGPAEVLTAGQVSGHD